MFEIQNKIISDDLFEEKFVCDLNKCKGMCCIEGDAGAPLTKEEIITIEKYLPEIKKEMLPEGIKAIQDNGFYYVDDENEPVTALLDNKECAFVVFDKNNIAKCAIELAHRKCSIDFIKPISCHLYPIRVKKHSVFESINIDKWNVCNAAFDCGSRNNVLVFKFLKEPIIRKWGLEFYKQLEIVNSQYYNQLNPEN